MIVAGLTGGIGSGKSYVAKYFESLGVPVYNSDARGRDLNNTHPVIKSAFIKRFGEDIYQNALLNRQKVAELVFNDKEALQWINNLVHPVVGQDFSIWKKQQNAPFIIKEAAILIESGAYKECDKLIVVMAPVELRIERVVKRDGLTKDQVMQRIANQMTDEERERYADFVIINDGILSVEKQIDKIINQLL
jgi:dephospho-CoA kinase